MTSPPVRTLLVAAGAVLVAACGGAKVRPLRPEYDLRAPDPELRTRAVATVAETRDASHVPTLIYLLDDDDDAVRAAAGAALVNLTGHDTGYRPYMDRLERRRHQEQWRAWYASSSGAAPSATPEVPAGSAPRGGSVDGRP